MVYRILSGLGWIAHLPDIVLAPMTWTSKPRPDLIAGIARFPGALILCILFGLVAAVGITLGNQGAENPSPTSYAVSGLAANPDVKGKIYATIGGPIFEWYVDSSNSDGKYDHTTYLVGDPKSSDLIIVVSKKPEAEMDPLVAADGTVTLTGMLRNNKGEIEATLRTLGTKAGSYNVIRSFVLVEGDSPPDAATMYRVAAVAGLITVPLLIGWVVGYVVFRPSKPDARLRTAGLSGPVPVRVTGLVPGPTNGLRAREQRAVLKLGEPSPEAGGFGDAPPVELAWVRGKNSTSIPLTPGTTKVVEGKAYPFLGARPAIRIRFHGYNIILNFDDVATRDAAFDHIVASGQVNQTAAAAPPA